MVARRSRQPRIDSPDRIRSGSDPPGNLSSRKWRGCSGWGPRVRTAPRRGCCIGCWRRPDGWAFGVG
eukprot:1184041-Prorocentrum_minimum.AAC.1